MDEIFNDAKALLAIPLNQPERLFPRDTEQARVLNRKLAGIWHPDRNPDRRASWVFAHLQGLYKAAQGRMAAGLWDSGRELLITTAAGPTYRLHYTQRRESDIGQSFVGRQVMAYLADGEHAGLARKGYETIRRLRFANQDMSATMARQLPSPIRMLEGKDSIALILRKRADFVALPELQRYLGGSVPARHVAWMVSGLLNLACYLEWAGLSHMAIAPEHCLVSPSKHGVALMGGWWCAEPTGAPIRVLPARSVQLAPPDILHRRLADPRLDALLIRQTALDLLGEKVSDAPTAMLDYLAMPGSGSAVADYEDWQQALWASFGERRFSELAVTADDVYGMAS